MKTKHTYASTCQSSAPAPPPEHFRCVAVFSVPPHSQTAVVTVRICSAVVLHHPGVKPCYVVRDHDGFLIFTRYRHSSKAPCLVPLTQRMVVILNLFFLSVIIPVSFIRAAVVPSSVQPPYLRTHYQCPPMEAVGTNGLRRTPMPMRTPRSLPQHL
ncbi:hypothetical protein C8R43DRAFT_1020534 [Mycena crocata]|nr:hypothetical protein C8R43DRAFT_1020534 [Mycena crocata]